jgi:hypothetical protein
MTNCNDYWQHADYLPLDLVITYWCEQSGFDKSHCREAKKAAILAGITSGLIKYKRSDGKPFQDDIYILAASNLLLIERDSFNAWATQFENAPIGDKPLGTTERTYLLRLVIGMAIDGYGYDPQAKKSDVTKVVADAISARGMDMTDDTVRKYLKEAVTKVLPAKQSQP